MRSAIPAVIMVAMVVSAHGQTNQEPTQMLAARVRFENAVNAATRTYVAELNSVQRQLMQQGNLDGALRVKTELDRLSGKASTPSSTPEEKPVDYVVFQGHRYQVVTASAKRDRAVSDCRKRGGALACADTTEELTFLHDLMRGSMVTAFWVDANVGIKGARYMRPNGALDIRLTKGIEDLPYICEWNQEPDSKPSDRTH